LDIGRALAFAHGQGLVHRDVKPQNVLLDADGRAKVTDFGIARTLDAVGHTETGTVLGTSHYVAPEQARGERVDDLTDVYSFGVVLWELLCGEVPYPGDSFLSVAMKHVNEPVPAVLERRPDAPLRLASLVESCMAKLPANRPPSMDVVVAELEACLAELDSKDGGEATMIIRKPVAKQPRSRRSRRLPVWPLVLGALLVAAVVAGILLKREDGAGTTAAGGAKLSGVGAYDPDGGDGEHDAEAGLATDGNAATFWRTSTYRSQLSAFKSGVGLVLEATGAPERIALTTDTPGFTAEVQSGSSRAGPFETVGDSKLVGESTSWDLRAGSGRYYVVWITQLVGSAHVNEVKAS
jgi:serine/threonine-protein kinase